MKLSLNVSLFVALCMGVQGYQLVSMRSGMITMRKQKASDKRTRRMQRGDVPAFLPQSSSSFVASTIDGVVKSPTEGAQWKQKRVSFNSNSVMGGSKSRGGRGRSQKRTYTYAALSAYHSLFCELLGNEFKAEEFEVLNRIESSRHNPLALEDTGHALFDMYPQRRGNIFTEEVYRLTKANDASSPNSDLRIPRQSQFSNNDVIILTRQPKGSGDIFGSMSNPTSRDATKAEARVIGTGPTYVDIAMPAGSFEASFGPAPNNRHGDRGDPNLRLRIDRFFSAIPFNRMISALSQITSLPEKSSDSKQESKDKTKDKVEAASKGLDPALREVVVSTYGYGDDIYPAPDADLQVLARKIAQAPFKSSGRHANEVLRFIQANPRRIFPPFNEPQLTAVGAALSRRLTMIQGPPGTGKTTVAAAIGFGFVHQARSLSPNARVLACAFSNVGADQLASALIKLGLKVIRVGKASSVSKDIRDYTLDAAIEADPDARKAQAIAEKATSQLGKGKISGAAKTAATSAVKASILARKVAATRALRSCDIIVSTSIGAADAQILAACGIVVPDDEEDEQKSAQSNSNSSTHVTTLKRDFAPDGGPPLYLPFTIIDEACQSVEPATLVPLVSSDSCRALVLLGDPCQLPPTVKTDPSGESFLAISLMSRLASVLPAPVIVTAKADSTPCDESFLHCKATRKAQTAITQTEGENVSYRSLYAGSLLLSVQYRMHPSIAAFSSAIYYDGLLKSPSILANLRNFPASLEERYPIEKVGKLQPRNVRFLNVGGSENEQRGARTEYDLSVMDGKRSYSNDAEAQEVLKVVRTILSEGIERASPPNIGIVSPYSGQVLLLKKLLAGASLPEGYEDLVEVNTVDGYQGRERDIIILSTVRSNRRNRVGFLSDWRRMNVAITRSKSALIVIGDIDTLSGGDRNWRAFGSWCRDVGCVHDIKN